MTTLTTSKILEENGYSNIFIVDPPELLADYILISNSGGFGIGSEDAGFSRPSIQIIVANKVKATLNTTIYAIRKLLYNLKNIDVTYPDIDNSELIQGYDISSDVIAAGMDEQRRYLASINFTVYENID